MKNFLKLVLLPIGVVLLLSTMTVGQPPKEVMPAVETFHPAQRVLYFVMKRGSDWLVQSQQPNGMFHQGMNVGTNTPLETSHFYHQAQAAVALARVSRLTSNPRYQAAALQASLTLLASTKVDVQDGNVRYTYLPEMNVNRLGSAGLLMRLVHELPMPAEVRLKEAEGLAGYVRTHQKSDGMFSSAMGDVQTVGADAGQEMLMRHYEGLAMEGLAISQTYSPAAWKSEALVKAARAYGQKVSQIPTAACPHYITALTDTYLRTKDQSCAEAVFNMADALCNAQKPLEPGKVAWQGGFVLVGQNMAPQAGESARCTTALCDAYRVATQMGDKARVEKYRQCASMGVQFIAGLQFTGAGVEHFAEGYQGRVLGAFKASPGEAVIRLQDGAECVLAVSAFLSDVCGVSLAPAQIAPSAPAPVK